MAELTLSAADIAAALKKNLDGFEPSLEARTVGRVMEVGDGIARVSGLPDAAVNELLEFEDGTVGLALNLDESSIGAVVLGDVDNIEEGQTVKSTGRILSIAREAEPLAISTARSAILGISSGDRIELAANPQAPLYRARTPMPRLDPSRIPAMRRSSPLIACVVVSRIRTSP